MLTDSTNEKQVDSSPWPVVDGSYVVGDPAAPVAVCALTSEELLKPLALLSGVAIAGQVQTANLGIERIILNVTANPSIRYLLLCGKESRLFQPGQSLCALLENGVDGEKRIVGARGYEPLLRNVPQEQIEVFRRQVELVDWSGEKDLVTLQERVGSLAARNPGRFATSWSGNNPSEAGAALAPRFSPIRPGGQREPLIYDPKGYFVITLDRAAGQIVLRHYLPDHSPAHEMRGRGGESMLLGLLREGLVSQLSHAGYLGAELAKAESALRLGIDVRYEQDRPLRREAAAAPEPADSGGPAPQTPRISAQNQQQFLAVGIGDAVNIACEVTASPSEHLLVGTFIEPAADTSQPIYQRTDLTLRVRWSADTEVVMGNASDFTPGAVLRTYGRLRAAGEVDAERVVVLTQVASISDDGS